MLNITFFAIFYMFWTMFDSLSSFWDKSECFRYLKLLSFGSRLITFLVYLNLCKYNSHSFARMNAFIHLFLFLILGHAIKEGLTIYLRNISIVNINVAPQLFIFITIHHLYSYTQNGLLHYKSLISWGISFSYHINLFQKVHNKGTCFRTS